MEHAKRPARLPVILTATEVRTVLAHLDGRHRLMANLLYGSGLRLTECVRLRVKDLDFEYRQLPCGMGRDRRPATTSARSRNDWAINDVSTTMIYTHVLNRGGRGVASPLDQL
jgi:site-specific recombinase XerD